MGDQYQYQRKSVQENAQIPASVPLPPLRPEQAAAVRHRRCLVHQHAPELVGVISDLVEAGLIDGWRSVAKVEIKATGEIV